MAKIKTAIVGTGFMGKVHTENVRRIPNVEVAAVVGSRPDRAQKFADAHGIPKATADLKEVLSDPQIAAVHICTPNVDHAPMSKAAIEAGKAVLCEKPLTMTSAEARELVELAKKKNAVNCVQHNLRYYPNVQQIRQMIAHGDLGEILIVQGTYSQDWLLYDTDWNWRIDSKENGPSRCFADIGTHWCDMIEHTTGLRIKSLCADLATFHPTRKRPKGEIETFAGKTLQPGDYDEVAIDTEDMGAMILRLGDKARGAMTVSQVSAGRKNYFRIEIYGSKASVTWDQESPDTLWIGHRNEPNQIMVKDPSLMQPAARSYADLPGGHSEGYDDTQKQTMKRFYRTVEDRSAPVEYGQFVDGLRGLQIVEKVLESSKKRAWVDL
jgi:predicted dehydrogenase